MEKAQFHSSSRRIDGRSFKEVRNIKIRLRVIASCENSLFLEIGINKVIIGICGPKLKLNSNVIKKGGAFFNFRIQIFSLKFYEFDTNDSLFMTILNRIIEEILLISLIKNSFYNIIVRILQNGGNNFYSILNGLSLSFLISGFPIKNFSACCTSGISNLDVFIDLTTQEWLLFQRKTFLVLENSCENKLILLENKSCLNSFALENCILTTINGCFQISLLKHSINRYSLKRL